MNARLRVFLLVQLVALGAACGGPRRATVTLAGKDGVIGTIVFTQTDAGVELEGQVNGLTPGKHGFHVHALGDLSNGCASTGGHFNPHNMTHGGPEDPVRHVGDLGNVEADGSGVAHVHMRDALIALHGDHSIVGRAIVVHAGQDDLGRGGAPDSLTTGNAGGRVACGIIGILSPDTCAAAGGGSVPRPGPATLALALTALTAAAVRTCRTC